MKVSIITSCFNRKETIRGAIESVLAQDYQDIEYIVVDGASTDNSLDIINEYKERIDIIVSEPDHGMYEAINKGIRMATGDVIGLVHSDDFLGVYVNPDDTTKLVRNWIGGPYYRWKVGMGWLPLHPTCYIRRDVMMREGLYDETYKIAADSDLLFRYLYKSHLKVVYLKRKIIRMRMGGLSTDSEKRKLMWDEDVRMYRSHGRWGIPTKLMKMAWKISQFVEAKFMKE